MINAAVSHTRMFRLQVSALVILCFCLFSPNTKAQERVPAAQTSRSSVNVHWNWGPVKVNYGAEVEINVPKGFEFVDQKNGARAIIENGGDTCPPNLVGIMAPVPGPGGNPEWYAIISDSAIGYVTDTD
jgi:uncharacterized membrane-anchored protein